MGELKIKDSDPLDYVYNTHEAVQAKTLTACAVKAEYPDVFQGLGRLKDSYSIEIDESVRPVVHAPRRVPVPMREKVRKKLDELVCWSIDERHRGNGLGIKYGDCPETKRTDQDMHWSQISELQQSDVSTTRCQPSKRSVLGWRMQDCSLC